MKAGLLPWMKLPCSGKVSEGEDRSERIRGDRIRGDRVCGDPVYGTGAWPDQLERLSRKVVRWIMSETVRMSLKPGMGEFTALK